MSGYKLVELRTGCFWLTGFKQRGSAPQPSLVEMTVALKRAIKITQCSRPVFVIAVQFSSAEIQLCVVRLPSDLPCECLDLYLNVAVRQADKRPQQESTQRECAVQWS